MSLRNYNIVYDNGKKYRIYTDGKCEKRLCCTYGDCGVLKYNNTDYCGLHQGGFINPPRPKKIQEYTEIIIDGQIIFINKNGHKFKLYDKDKNSKRRICMFDNCASMVHKGLYCKSHEDGIEYAEIKFDCSYNDDNGNIIHDNQEYRDKCKNATLIGDETEKYIIDILHDCRDLEFVEKIGHTGDRIDIIYKFKSENTIRGLQVKTLCCTDKSNVYRSTLVRTKSVYTSDTLIVLVNKDKNKFGLIFYGDCPKTGITLTFRNQEKSKYKDNMFIDFNLFKEKLIGMMKSSVEYIENISHTTAKEKDSINRLKSICDEKKLNFKMSDTFTSVFDCYINNKKIQCRSSNQKHGLQYSFSMSKSGSNENFKHTRIKYSVNDDIDFFVFEIISYPGNFYIIPKLKLIEEKVISSNSTDGKWSIQIPPIGYTNKLSKYYWMLDYINKFELLE